MYSSGCKGMNKYAMYKRKAFFFYLIITFFPFRM